MGKNLPLRETIRQYPSKENLSNEAAQLFIRVFKEHDKATTPQKAFSAAKRAVEELPKESRYKTDSDNEESEQDHPDADEN